MPLPVCNLGMSEADLQPDSLEELVRPFFEDRYDTFVAPRLPGIDGELSMLFSDISHTLRLTRRTPLFTGTVVLTMLVIAASKTVF